MHCICRSETKHSGWSYNQAVRKKSRKLVIKFGRTTPQAICRWLHIAAARVRDHIRSYEICGGQFGTGAWILRVLRFHLPVIPPTASHSTSSIIQVWYDRPKNSSLTKWTQETKKVLMFIENYILPRPTSPNFLRPSVAFNLRLWPFVMYNHVIW
jgi:hypothetical protein